MRVAISCPPPTVQSRDGRWRVIGFQRRAFGGLSDCAFWVIESLVPPPPPLCAAHRFGPAQTSQSGAQCDVSPLSRKSDPVSSPICSSTTSPLPEAGSPARQKSRRRPPDPKSPPPHEQVDSHLHGVTAYLLVWLRAVWVVRDGDDWVYPFVCPCDPCEQESFAIKKS